MLSADLILKNAIVITMSPERPQAEMVAIAGDKILAVGDKNETSILTGKNTRMIDCGGKTLVPGFNDAHCHIFSMAISLSSIDVSPWSVKSIGDIKELIRTRVREIPPGKWISATGYNEYNLADKRHPNRWDIDEAAPDNPVVVSHRSLHSCILNSRALSLANLTKESIEPPGKVFERDPKTGELSGVLYEMLGYIRASVLPPLSETEQDQSLTDTSRHYLANGITSVQDESISNIPARWNLLKRLQNEGKFALRASMTAGTDSFNDFIKGGYPRSGDKNLRFGGLKIILNQATGKLFPSQEDLNTYVLGANKKGYRVSIHAVTAEMVEAAIIAYEYAREHNPENTMRNRIEHCSECPPELMARLRKLGIIIVSQPLFLYYSGDRYLETLAPETQPWLYRFKTFIDSGLITAASSDSPVVPDNPLIGMYAAVTRKTKAGRKVNSKECINAQQALQMYTINAAFASGEEYVKGSLTPGKLADMVVLSDNPLTVSPEKIKDIKVEMTIVGGKLVCEK
ncbi:MAG: amidohydrolase [Dehalococcoidales bacterium]|nr:amidohydrolase [Dehalococcoidales bacterium]